MNLIQKQKFSPMMLKLPQIIIHTPSIRQHRWLDTYEPDITVVSCQKCHQA